MSTRWEIDEAVLESRTPEDLGRFAARAEPQEHLILLKAHDPDSTYGGYKGWSVALGITLKDWAGQWVYAPAGGHVRPPAFDTREDALEALIRYRRATADYAITAAQKERDELEEAIAAAGLVPTPCAAERTIDTP